MPSRQVGLAAAERIPESTRLRMAEIIAAHAGCEVLFLCDLGENGQISAIADRAHGNRGMVPVLAREIEPGQVIIHNHPSGRLIPSDADIQVAAQLTDQGVGSWICDNAVERLYVITEAFQAPRAQALDREACQAIADANGALARGLKDFKPREGQITMIGAVADAFNESQIVAVEAGTGVGKSYAYLIPALLWAASNRERVVVATATINLQQQLIEKDIPMVNKLLGLEVKAVLAKGRGNYLCRKRLHEAIDEEGLLAHPQSQLVQIRDWTKNTRDGSRHDLPFLPEEDLWSRVNADADVCPGLRCPYHGECFFFQARREAAGAGLIVANHHLVMADAAMRTRGLGFESTVVLPAFQRLIFDEAHNVEGTATTYFSAGLNRLTILKYLGMLLRKRQGQNWGLLAAAEKLGVVTVAKFEPLLTAIRDQAFGVDGQARELLGETNNRRLGTADREAAANLVTALIGLHASLASFGTALIEALSLVDLDEPHPTVQELDLMARRLVALAETAEAFRAFDRDSDRVYYLERLRLPSGDSAVELVVSPLDVGPLLTEAVFRPYPTVVLTSATLTIRGRFDYVLGRLGLVRAADSGPTGEWLEDGQAQPQEIQNGAEAWPVAGLERALLTLRVPSPFDYRSRVLVGVPQDGPDPTDSRYNEWLARFVTEALLASGGHALVLFTAYEALKQSYEYAQPILAAAGITCLRQGSEERSRLLRLFNSETSSCLFATDSFWEGVDSPGEALQLLILGKLPFRVPTEPLALARSERIEARGGRPFFELSLPEAVMKFRQGFGRLMRREDDFGVVLVADRRILTKPYGRDFIDSLPLTAQVAASGADLIENASSFLARWRRQ